MKSLNHSQIQGAVVVFLAAIMSSAALMGVEVPAADTVHSFVGTAPDASTVDVLPATF